MGWRSKSKTSHLQTQGPFQTRVELLGALSGMRARTFTTKPLGKHLRIFDTRMPSITHLRYRASGIGLGPYTMSRSMYTTALHTSQSQLGQTYTNNNSKAACSKYESMCEYNMSIYSQCIVLVFSTHSCLLCRNKGQVYFVRLTVHGQGQGERGHCVHRKVLCALDHLYS